MSKKSGLFILIFTVTCFVMFGEPGEKPVDVKIIPDQKITMRDGVKLSARIWMPEEIKEPLPTIFVFTPYISDESQKRGMFFAKNGYVYTSVDVRGRGNSQGIFFPLEGDKHSKDIYDIVNWIAKQPWSDGQVTMRGGSYRGMVQWQAMKTRPLPLKTIVPTDAVYPGIDFPIHHSIFFTYMACWLSLTSGVTGNDNLFSDDHYWNRKYLELYNEHVPFCQFWKLAGIEERIFKRWVAHPYYDEFWQNFAPAPEDYRDIHIPILNITCYFFGDQLGHMTYYRNFMKYASRQARGKNYLIIGPWDHGGTRYPKKELMGLTFGDNAVLDMDQLHLEWYDWHLKGKKRPQFLKDRVCYYVIGANQWKYASSLDEVYNDKQTWYLSSDNGNANDVFHSGKLTGNKPGIEKPDRFEYDPLDPISEEHIWFAETDANLDQTDALSGENLVYHSPRLKQDLEVSGFITFNAYLALNVPDTDLEAALYEIKPNGTGIFLTFTFMRARYRNSISSPTLVKPGEINLYRFDTFDFFSRRLSKGSRLRLVFGPLKNPFFEKNYNSGGIVAQETAKDARKAVITLYHDKKHPSHLVLPVSGDQ
jgi:putative CocE/NonD family hydrolase